MFRRMLPLITGFSKCYIQMSYYTYNFRNNSARRLQNKQSIGKIHTSVIITNIDRNIYQILKSQIVLEILNSDTTAGTKRSVENKHKRLHHITCRELQQFFQLKRG